jgi:hypothetical protein
MCIRIKFYRFGGGFQHFLLFRQARRLWFSKSHRRAPSPRCHWSQGHHKRPVRRLFGLMFVKAERTRPSRITSLQLDRSESKGVLLYAPTGAISGPKRTVYPSSLNQSSVACSMMDSVTLLMIFFWPAVVHDRAFQ